MMTASTNIVLRNAPGSGIPRTAALMTAAGGTLQDTLMAGNKGGSPAMRGGGGSNARVKNFWSRNVMAAGSTMSASTSTRLMTCAPIKSLTVVPMSAGTMTRGTPFCW